MRTVNLVLAGALAVVAVTGIVEAQVTYQPDEVVVKKRAIPDVSSAIAPLALPERGGGVLGIEGRF